MKGRRKELADLSGGHPDDRRHVWYALRGPDLDPAEITDATGIAPDQAWKAGDGKPRTGLPYSEGAWLIDSGLGEADEFHDHLDALLARLRPAWHTFANLGQRYEADVDAAIYCMEAQGPLVIVVPEVSASLVELNASLGFDLYALAGSDESPIS
jgi:hypothetical protein